MSTHATSTTFPTPEPPLTAAPNCLQLCHPAGHRDETLVAIDTILSRVLSRSLSKATCARWFFAPEATPDVSDAAAERLVLFVDPRWLDARDVAAELAREGYVGATPCAMPTSAWLPRCGGAGGLQLFYDCARTTHVLAIDIVRSCLAGEADKSGVVFDLMLANAFVTRRDIKIGFLAFRSHADGFILRTDDPIKTRALFDQRYRARRGMLQEHLPELLQMLATPGDSFAQRWVAALTPIQQRARVLAQNGRITYPGSTQSGAFAETLLSASPFYLAMAQNERFRTHMSENKDFIALRFLVNALYDFIDRLGTSACERYLIGHLVASTVEDAYQLDSAEMVRNFS